MKIYIDLTNMLNQGFLSGIQRVVREITLRLVQKAEVLDHEIVLLFYNDGSKKYILIDNEKYLSFLNGSIPDKADCFTRKTLSIFDFESGSVFFDLDTVWVNKVRRTFLFPILKNHNIRILTFLHDLIPITCPQFIDPLTVLNFSNFLSAGLKYSDQFIVSTKSTRTELEKIQDRIGIGHKDTVVLPFGFDFDINTQTSETDVADIVKRIKLSGPYILCVGTIEIRKNHKIILDAFETKLHKDGLQLVFAGRTGWMVDDLLARIAKQPQRGKGFYFLEGLNDASINYLYENAFLTVSASFIEGFGLPLIESIMRGTPALASDIPVFREVGGRFCGYFNPEDVNDLVQKIEYLLNNPEIYVEKKKLLASYKPVTWDEAGELFSQVLFAEQKPESFHQPLKQVVLRSERAEILLGTIGYIEHFMPFVSEIVLCASQENGDKIIRRYSGRLKIILLSDRASNGEKDVSSGISVENEKEYFFLLDERVDHEFILSEDNYRPLVPLTEEYFLHDGRYQAYYCGDFFAGEMLSDKPFFNDQQTKTALFLKNHEYPSLNYDSHQPQVMNKSWFLELLGKHEEVKNEDLSEWSVYFNVCVHNHPRDFMVLPYQTLNWKFGTAGLESFVRPQKYCFENYDEAFYAGSQPFCSFSQSWHAGSISENFEKIQIFERIRQQTESAGIAEKVFSQIYAHRYRELPSFVMEYYQDKLKFYVPDEFAIVNEAEVNIDLHIVWRDLPENAVPAFSIEWDLRTSDNILITGPSRIDVSAGQSFVTLKLNAQISEPDVFLCITGRMAGSGKTFSKNIRVQVLYL